MLIRKSTINDLPSILKLIQDGRQKMISEGNITQWTNGHPSNEQIISDIRKGVSHIIIDESTHQPIATFALIEGPDPTYAQIYDGQWLAPPTLLCHPSCCLGTRCAWHHAYGS